MNAFFQAIIITVALILMGVFATFFILLNWLRQKERIEEYKKEEKK